MLYNVFVIIMKRKIILLLLILVTLTGCRNKYNIPDEVIFNYQIKEVNVYEDFYLNDFKIDTNARINKDNIKIDTQDIGSKEIEVPIIYDNKEYIYILKYNIIDTIKPTLISASSSYTILLNEEIDPCSKAIFADNYDRKPICQIEGSYDKNNAGEYKLQYIFKDNSNNEVKKDLTINVVKSIEEEEKPKTEKESILFDDVIKTYKNENTMIGIDVSRYQEDIDFNKVKEAGCEFVIIRMGINSDINKDISMDSYFLENIKKAHDANLLVGIYIYSSATNINTAINHAKWTINNLNGLKLDLGIVFDWENWSKIRNYNINIHDLNKTYEAFAAYIKVKGYTPILYSSKYYLENFWTNKNNDKVWLAHYTKETNYKGKYGIWQMTNIGKINGIKGDVDIDILYQN